MRAAFAALAALSLALGIGCAREPGVLFLSGPTMGTTYTVRVIGTEELPAPDSIRRQIEAELARVDQIASRYRDDSEVMQFNLERSTDWQRVSHDLAKLVAEAKQITAASNGAFDVTIAPVVDAWGFGPAGEAALPDESKLASMKPHTGAHLIEVRVEPPAIRKQHGALSLDLNAIAPGYAVDRLCEILERLGARNYLVDIGGEIRVKGVNARQQPWRVAVEDPSRPTPTPYAFIELREGATATSGGYRRFTEVAGRRYSHVLDARTARPVTNNVGSVAVIAPTATHADAWATALYALGFDEGMQVARTQKLAAMFLMYDGSRVTSYTSPEFDAYRTR